MAKLTRRLGNYWGPWSAFLSLCTLAGYAVGYFLDDLRLKLTGCRCGHHRNAHRHYRRGMDCGKCKCKRFRHYWRFL